MLEYIIYFTIACLVALGFAAWDNGERWNTSKYLFLGAFWIVSIPIILYVLTARKVKKWYAIRMQK